MNVCPVKQLLPDNHPVFQACKSGDYDAVAKYLAEGVSVYAESEHHPAIFGIVANRGHKRILELMLQYGLDITRPHNRFGASVGEFAVAHDSVEWLEYFLEKGVHADHRDAHGLSLLSIASAGGKLEVLKFLLDKGCEIESKNQSGCTPFREAARNNQIAAMQMLEEYGADIESRDATKTTPLIGCAKGGKLEALEWLLDHGADLHARDQRGKTALDWAKANGHEKVVALLEARMKL